MQLLTVVGAAAQAAPTDEQAWWEHPLSLLIAAVISGGVLVFLVKRAMGRRRPHEVTVADYWWTRPDGRLVTEQDPFGPVDGYETLVRLQVKGRRIEGARSLTNLTLVHRPRPWHLSRLWQWQRATSSLDLVGEHLAKIRDEGVSLGDDDTPMLSATVVQEGRSGHFDLSGRWRLVPWAGALHGVSKPLHRVVPEAPQPAGGAVTD